MKTNVSQWKPPTHASFDIGAESTTTTLLTSTRACSNQGTFFVYIETSMWGKNYSCDSYYQQYLLIHRAANSPPTTASFKDFYKVWPYCTKKKVGSICSGTQIRDTQTAFKWVLQNDASLWPRLLQTNQSQIGIVHLRNATGLNRLTEDFFAIQDWETLHFPNSALLCWFQIN